ncbi:hypothetical protein H2200_005230 [Cladophialophora chaetospira]|uniref:DUF2241 domain-containing protein n=1 Tax=Cladophialophora chaetospira TaxID=386627 RepID=A0AA39CJP8_9EURO|nr:hypothetical protein H2200_005230 [Cladophialophora chaetospira]
MSAQESLTDASNKEGETSLSALLSTLNIVLHPTTYVFATILIDHFSASDFPIPVSDILLFFREPCTDISGSSPSAEQTTLILPLSVARQHGIESIYPCKMLTCNVHSSLSAVGFMATLAKKLTERGISMNPVSGFFHDHLFVPVDRADEAVEVLDRVRKEAAENGE